MQETPSMASVVPLEDCRTAVSVEDLKRGILDNLYFIVGVTAERATNREFFVALAYAVRDRILAKWLKTKDDYARADVRVVSYLSAEFLVGPHLANNIFNLQLEDPIKQALTELGRDLNELIEEESEPGLGNGGLGRLAACYLDSLATLVSLLRSPACSTIRRRIVSTVAASFNAPNKSCSLLKRSEKAATGLAG